jgi:hypothetical protein
MPTGRIVLLAVALIHTVAGVTAMATPKPQVVKGIAIEVLAVERTDRMKMFPTSGDTFMVEARPGFEFVVVRFTVAPQATSPGRIDIKTMAVVDASGASHACAWKETDMCDGTRSDTCEFPFPVPRGTMIIAFHIEGLVFAVDSSSVPTHGTPSSAPAAPRAARPASGAPGIATNPPASDSSKLTDSCDHDIPGGEPSAAYRAYFASCKDVKSVEAFLAQLAAANQVRLSAILSSASDDVREQFLAQVRQVTAMSRLVITAEKVEGERALLTVCLMSTEGTAPPRVATVVMVREGGVWRVAEEQQ